MPKAWDDNAHKERKVLKDLRTETSHFDDAINLATEVALAHKKVVNTTIVALTNATLPTMRNWVIKSLCGLNAQLLRQFPIYYPTLEDDFIKLSYHIDEVTEKCRKANHSNTKK